MINVDNPYFIGVSPEKIENTDVPISITLSNLGMKTLLEKSKYSIGNQQESQITIAGLPATQITGTEIDLGKVIAIYLNYLKEPKNTIIIRLNDYSKLDIFNQIISGLKFFEQKDINGWYTHNNEFFDFSFSYPADMEFEQRYTKQQNFLSLSLANQSLNGMMSVNHPGIGFENFSVGISTEEMDIDGIKTSLRLTEENPKYTSTKDLKRGVFVDFNQDNDRYFMLFTYKKEGVDQLELVKKIISTFKFND